MEFGICLFVTNYSIQVADLAKAVDDQNSNALFTPDHIHIPVSRQSSLPIGRELSTYYSHNVDMFLGLTAAAASLCSNKQQ